MSEFTDMYIKIETKAKLVKFAADKNLTLAELLEHICAMIELQQSRNKGDTP